MVAQSGPGTPSTGSVTFTVDGIAQPATPLGSNGAVGLQLSGLSAGLHQGSANYGGSTDGTYLASSNSTSFTVSPASQTITPGQSAIYTLTLASVKGLSGNVSLGCSGGPANSTCSITPASVTLNGTATVTATATVLTSANSNYGAFTVEITGELGALTRPASANLTLANVAVSSPLPNSTVSTTVPFVASTTSNSSTATIKTMTIYVDKIAKYGASSNANAIPEGALIQLDPAFNVSAQSWPPWEKTIATALQTYGAYVVDTSGALALYAVSDMNTSNTTWASVGMTKLPSLSNLPWSSFRVIQIQSCN